MNHYGELLHAFDIFSVDHHCLQQTHRGLIQYARTYIGRLDSLGGPGATPRSVRQTFRQLPHLSPPTSIMSILLCNDDAWIPQRYNKLCTFVTHINTSSVSTSPANRQQEQHTGFFLLRFKM